MKLIRRVGEAESFAFSVIGWKWYVSPIGNIYSAFSVHLYWGLLIARVLWYQEDKWPLKISVFWHRLYTHPPAEGRGNVA